VASIVASAEASMVASGEAHHCHPGLRLLLHRNVWFIHKQLLSCYQLPRILSIDCAASEADSHMNERMASIRNCLNQQLLADWTKGLLYEMYRTLLESEIYVP